MIMADLVTMDNFYGKREPSEGLLGTPKHGMGIHGRMINF